MAVQETALRMHAGISVVLSLGLFLCLATALPTRDQILELYHRAPQHIKDALARHGIHAHNLPSPASLANLHSSSSLISSHPGLANRLNLHALASRAQAILKRPPSQLPFPIPTFNKNSAQFQRRSGLVLPFSASSGKNEQKETPQPTFSGPAPQIVTVPPMIEGLQQQNTHIKPVSSIINFGPAPASSSSSASDGIITGRPMREGQLPVKPQTTSPSAIGASSPPSSSASSSSASQNLRKPNRREEPVVSARSFSDSLDSGDNPLSRPFSLPLNVRNPKYEYGGFVPISSSPSSSLTSSSSSGFAKGGSRGVGSAGGGSNIITSPLSTEKHGLSHRTYANGFMIDDEPITANSAAIGGRSRDTGITASDAVVPEAATYNLIKKATALVEDCQLKKQDFCIMDDETYPKVEIEHFPAECTAIVNAMYVKIPQSLIQSSDRSLCESDRKLKRLAVARDIHGQWAIIVQSSKWSQKAHLNVCRNEGRPCQRLGGCSVKTKCVQKYAPQMLIALDSLNPDACPSLRAFNLPSGCECYSAEPY
ncbi:uncharacterized protein LOC114828558 [Galendromus occidentalis]|uniref:Uncharacterized protein LOC114828558 n=1 Tax=Galendromus occidentalis TaxID=34638 RepID=A0AAJ7SJ22_9ACAR|nr:uncharacterized protein LOC114828558 [Galendromus occidentalis]